MYLATALLFCGSLSASPTSVLPSSPSPDGDAASANASAKPVASADPRGVEPDAIKFKPGKGLTFESRDGRFGMAIRSRVQLRYELEHAEDESPQTAHVLSVRRARFQIAGHVFDPHLKYKLQLALSPQDMQFGPTGARQSPVLDAIVTSDHLRDLNVSAGQFMVPFNRQRIISSGSFELVDRSLGNGEFQQDRDIGVQLSSDDLAGTGYLRYIAGVFMGEGRDAYLHGDTGLLYVARVEVVPTGESAKRWDYTEGDLDHVPRPKLSLGAAYAHLDGTTRNRGVVGNVPSDGGTTDMNLVTADVTGRWMGVSASGEFYWRGSTRDYGNATTTDEAGNEIPAPTEPPRDGFGWYAQLGYVVPPAPLGIAVRYGQVRGRPTAETSLGHADEIAAGPSWYVHGHDVKLQADYTRRWDPDDATSAEHLIRVQLSAGF